MLEMGSFSRGGCVDQLSRSSVGDKTRRDLQDISPSLKGLCNELMSIFSLLQRKRVSLPIPAGPCWPLDLPLVEFSKRSDDLWTMADSFQGVAILGENGSGKTSGSGQLLARKYLQAGFGGLVLCFKTDEADLWRSYLKTATREADGRFFSVENGFRFNFMDYEAKASGIDFAENLVTLLIDIASIQKRTEASGSEAHFWLPQKKKLLRNAIGLLLFAGEPIQLRTLYRLISDAPKDANESKSQEWQRKSFLFSLLCAAEEKARDNPEWNLIQEYWMGERPSLPPKTRETIDADFTGMFDPLTRGKIGELFGTATDLSPDDILEGKVVVVDIPVAKYRDIGQYAALIWAQLFQRAVDRRTYVSPGSRPRISLGRRSALLHDRTRRAFSDNGQVKRDLRCEADTEPSKFS